MGIEVATLITFPASGTSSVRPLAQQLHEQLSAGGSRSVGLIYLQELAAGRGLSMDSKGGFISWAVSVNRFDVSEMVEFLRPFWRELLRDRAYTTGLGPEWRPGVRNRMLNEELWDGPRPTNVILVLYKHEMEYYARAITITSPYPHWGPCTDQVEITHYDQFPLPMNSVPYELTVPGAESGTRGILSAWAENTEPDEKVIEMVVEQNLRNGPYLEQRAKAFRWFLESDVTPEHKAGVIERATGKLFSPESERAQRALEWGWSVLNMLEGAIHEHGLDRSQEWVRAAAREQEEAMRRARPDATEHSPDVRGDA